MTTTQDTTQADPLPPQAEPIPNPPGGGSWQWDADAKQWISREQPAQQPTDSQE